MMRGFFLLLLRSSTCDPVWRDYNEEMIWPDGWATSLPPPLPQEDKRAVLVWKANEDAALVRAVAKFGVGKWKHVASAVRTRDHVQCAQRWQKGLFPEEERKLDQLRHVLPPWGSEDMKENWGSESILHPEAHVHKMSQCNCPLRTCQDAFTGVDAFVDGYRFLSEVENEVEGAENAGDLGIPWIASWPLKTCCTEAICCRVLQAAFPGLENVSAHIPAFPWFCGEELVTVLPSELEPYDWPYLGDTGHTEPRTPLELRPEPYDWHDWQDLLTGEELHELANKKFHKLRRKKNEEEVWMAWLKTHLVLVSMVGVKGSLKCNHSFVTNRNPQSQFVTNRGLIRCGDESILSTVDCMLYIVYCIFYTAYSTLIDIVPTTPRATGCRCAGELAGS
jgi:hypothetical protein